MALLSVFFAPPEPEEGFLPVSTYFEKIHKKN